jgi:hypothetical protein
MNALIQKILKAFIFAALAAAAAPPIQAATLALELDRALRAAEPPDAASPFLAAVFDGGDEPRSALLALERRGFSERAGLTDWYFRFESSTGPLAARPAVRPDSKRAVDDPRGFLPFPPTAITGNGVRASSFDHLDPARGKGPLFERQRVKAMVERFGQVGWSRSAATGDWKRAGIETPEPGTMLLVGGGLLVLGGWVRRRTKR